MVHQSEDRFRGALSAGTKRVYRRRKSEELRRRRPNGGAERHAIRLDAVLLLCAL
jgi:hypothetical protein